MNKTSLKKISNFSEEYAHFITEYLFRLFGISTEIDLIAAETTCEKEPARIRLDGDWIFFSAFTQQFFKMPASDSPLKDSDSISLANKIIEAFLSCAEFKVQGGTDKYNRYRNHVAKEKAYKLAIQDGLAQWIFGVTNGEILAKFFDLLEKWSVKTYEGKHVTLGFLVDPSSQKETILSFDELLAFLNDDSSAVLSDCIHSILELDKKCNLVGYHSITEDLKTLPSCDLSDYVPIRFIQTVQQFIPYRTQASGSDKVGVFLLSNGDILLVKSGATRFVKRNLQWLNLSEPAFINSLKPIAANLPLDAYAKKQLLKSIYASVLDVSFSHTGGIVAIVNPNCIEDLMKNRVLSPFDNLKISDEAATQLMDENGCPQATQERVVRRKLLKTLVHNSNFDRLDRKLRSELIALDGACIIDFNGSVYSFGAIIQNDSGSATGGRSSAAKKLSSFGAAIKISTDGYIDIYIDTDLVYSIK